MTRPYNQVAPKIKYPKDRINELMLTKAENRRIMQYLWENEDRFKKKNHV